jgi:hypothetical protein
MHVVWKRVHWCVVVFDGNKAQLFKDISGNLLITIKYVITQIGDMIIKQLKKSEQLHFLAYKSTANTQYNMLKTYMLFYDNSNIAHENRSLIVTLLCLFPFHHVIWSNYVGKTIS